MYKNGILLQTEENLDLKGLSEKPLGKINRLHIFKATTIKDDEGNKRKVWSARIVELKFFIEALW